MTMAAIMSINDRHPRVHPSVFVADGTHIIGDVTIGTDASVWFNVTLRGDINSITIGDRTNIQDGCVLHVTNDDAVVVGRDVTVGHRAIVHGCRVEDCSLIGMGAVVLDGARVGPSALVAAGAVVLQGFVIPEGMLAAGVPARVIRPLTGEERDQLLQSAVHYTQYAQQFKNAAGRT
jgi:carbonic anhydrase/acetyltransferase-like protein (isoleucine patch superfamily)